MRDSASRTSETREVMRAAAQWLAVLDGDEVSESDLTRIQAWRNSDLEHERAWQREMLLRQRFSGLPPELAMASLDRPDLGRRKAIKRGLGLIALVPTAWLVSRQLPLDVWRADLATNTGEQQQVKLADGSLLRLNTDSAVELELDNSQLRLVRGEIALKVPGNSPLSILTPYGRTRFSQGEVCVRLDEQFCRVSVIDGSAQVFSVSGETQLLAQGQQLDLRRSRLVQAESFDPALPGWREGVLMAQDQPLGDFLRELNRYHPGILRWDPALERLRVTGSFRLDDTDRVLELLAASLPLEVQARTRYWVTLVPRQKVA